MKIYQKKNVSLEDETALVHLDRRHTIKEVTSDVDLENNLRKTSRANSLGFFEEGHSSTEIEVVTTEKKKNITRRPTVITESELASSSLYKDRKAKINSDDESIEDPSSTMPSENYEDLEPRVLQNPNLKPVPVSNQRPRKMSSCCWYFTIVLVICIACVAVMASVGGIVYMEVFAPFVDKSDVMDSDTLTKNDKNPSVSNEISRNSTNMQDSFHRNEIKIPEGILKGVIKNRTYIEPGKWLVPQDTDTSRKVTTSQTEENIPHDKNLTQWNISTDKNLGRVKDRFVLMLERLNQDVRKTEQPKTAEHSVISRNTHGKINQLNIPILNKPLETLLEVKNQDSSDLNVNYHNIAEIIDVIPDANANKVTNQITGNEIIVNENSNSKVEVPDSNEETFAIGRNFNFDEMTTVHTIELKDGKVNEDVSFKIPSELNRNEHAVHLPTNSNTFDMKNSINDELQDISIHKENWISGKLEDKSFDVMENLINGKPDKRKDFIEPKLKDKSPNHVKNFTDHSFNDNSLKHSIDNNPNDTFLDPAVHSIDRRPNENFMDLSENSNEDSSEEMSIDHTNHLNPPPKKPSNNRIEDSIEDNSEDSSFEHTNHLNPPNKPSNNRIEDSIDDSSEDSSLEHTNHLNPPNKSSNNHIEDSSDFESNESSEELSRSVDQNQNSNDSQLVFIRPIVESKAVPVPLAFLRRIGFDIKNPNSHQPLTAKDMDIKFSLAEALKYLRSLDTDNKLPTSRERNVPRERSNQEESKKTELPIISEREDYLNILRKKMFEKSL